VVQLAYTLQDMAIHQDPDLPLEIAILQNTGRQLLNGNGRREHGGQPSKRASKGESPLEALRLFNS
jgi:hypothetical protein